MTPFRRILVPMDFEAGCLETLREAIDLARACCARVHLVHALAVRESRGTAARQWAIDRFQDVLAANGEVVSEEFFVQCGPAVSVILEAMDSLRVDLVVLRAPRNSWGHIVTNSIVATLQRDSTVPLCVVPWPAERYSGSCAARNALRVDLSLKLLALVLGVGGVSAGTWAALAQETTLAAVGIALGLGATGALALISGMRGGVEVEAAPTPRAWTPQSTEPALILVPVPAQGPGDALLVLIERLVTTLRVRVMLLHVLSPTAARSSSGTRKVFESLLCSLQQTGFGEIFPGLNVRTGDCLEEIVAAAVDWRAHSIAVDPAGGQGLPPSAIRRLARWSPCPVWFVPGRWLSAANER